MNVFHSGRPGEVAAVDIVFVHGLHGDSIKSWSHKGVCWPRDLLKHDLENARIMSWAYDARIAAWKGPTGQGSVFGNAETLLSDLANERLFPIESSRPIIFVGHSLGGLVIKEALIRSAQLFMHKETPELGSIYQFTAGVLFVGTPHRGSDKVQLADMLVLAAKMTWKKPNDELLRSLRSNAGALNQQRASFTTIMDGFSVVCLYESDPTRVGMIVPEDSACFDGRNIRRDMLPGDHRGMCKFSDRNQTGYKRMLGHIKRLVAATGETCGTSADSRSESGDSSSASPPNRGLFIEAAPHDSLYVTSSALRPGIADAPFSPALNIPTRILPAATHKFLGRPDEMAAIHLCLEGQRNLSSSSSRPRTCIIHGMGGVGKSALARQYVEEHRDGFDIACWIPSGTRHGILQRYRDLGRELRIPGHESLGIRDEDAERTADWLSNCEFNWMLVFDGIDDPEDFCRFIPRSMRQRGSVLCTTQDSRLSSDEEECEKHITVQPLDSERGASFLLQRLKLASDPRSDVHLTAAKATSKLLGGLPLFLVAVADFLSDSGWSISDFVERYDKTSHQWPGVHASADLDGPRWYRHLRDHSTVFDCAFRKLSSKGREAMSIFALLDGAEIAESLVFSQHDDDVLDFLRPRSNFSEPSLHILARELQRHHLVQRATSPSSRIPILTINTMVQQMIRRTLWQEPDSKSSLQTAHDRAYQILRRATPAASKYQEPIPGLDPHLQTLRLDRHISHFGALASKYGIGPADQNHNHNLATLLYDAGFLVWRRQIDLSDGIRLFNQALHFLPNNKKKPGDDDNVRDDLLRSHIYLVAGRTYADMMMTDDDDPKSPSKPAHLFRLARVLRQNIYERLGPYNRSLSHRIWLFCARADVAAGQMIAVGREGEGGGGEAVGIERARNLLQDCLADYSSWSPEQAMPSDIAKVHYGLASCHLLLGDPASAVRCADSGRAALMMMMEGSCLTKGDLSMMSHGGHLFPHACFLRRLGRRDESLALHERVLEARVRVYGEQGLPTLRSREAIAALMRDGA